MTANYLPQPFAKTNLAKVPLEIRLQIYKLAVPEVDASYPYGWPRIMLAKPSTASRREGEEYNDHPGPQARSRLQLLCVCRQMHEEAFGIVCSQFYSRCILGLRDAAALHSFLTTLSAPRLQHVIALHVGSGLVDHVFTDIPTSIQEDPDNWYHSTAPDDPVSRSVYVGLRSRHARFGDQAQESRCLLAKCTGLRMIYFDVHTTDWTSFRKWLSPTVPARPTYCIQFHGMWQWTLRSPCELEQAALSHTIWVPMCEEFEEDTRGYPQGSWLDRTEVLQVALEAAPAEIFGGEGHVW